MVKQEQESANRPDNTAFTQQRLPAWQPMLSAGIVIPGFVVIGLAFIGIGVALFVTSQSIQVMEVWLWTTESINQSGVMLRLKGLMSQAKREEEEKKPPAMWNKICFYGQHMWLTLLSPHRLVASDTIALSLKRCGVSDTLWR